MRVKRVILLLFNSHIINSNEKLTDGPIFLNKKNIGTQYLNTIGLNFKFRRVQKPLAHLNHLKSQFQVLSRPRRVLTSLMATIT